MSITKKIITLFSVIGLSISPFVSANAEIKKDGIKRICTPDIRITKTVFNLASANTPDNYSDMMDFISLSNDNGKNWTAKYEGDTCAIYFEASGIVNGNSKIIRLRCLVSDVGLNKNNDLLVTEVNSCEKQ